MARLPSDSEHRRKNCNSVLNETPISGAWERQHVLLRERKVVVKFPYGCFAATNLLRLLYPAPDGSGCGNAKSNLSLGGSVHTQVAHCPLPDS